MVQELITQHLIKMTPTTQPHRKQQGIGNLRSNIRLTEQSVKPMRGKQFRHSFWVITLAVLFGGVVVAQTSEPPISTDEAADKPVDTSLPLEELNMFAQVFGKIKSDYVEAVDDKKMLRDAINGILAGLDPHSNFLGEEAFREMRIDTQGEFGGLGIEVTMEKGVVKVVAPIDDTPAYHAGVKAGDIISHIDGSQLGGTNLSEAVKKMRGESGSKTTLTIVRKGEKKPLQIVVVRDIIKLVSVKTRDLGEPGYAYMRVTTFQSATAQKLKEKIAQFKADNQSTVKGLILDLRNNPGGLLRSAVDISDLFLKQDAGTIVETRGRISTSMSSFEADSPDILDGAPMVVLVNNGSASASEIVAGSLQDHKRAIIYGTTTFGKGSVQTITPIGKESALKITTARYYTPSGRSIQETGIKPDIIAERVEIVKVPERSGRREVNLSGHLINESAADKDEADQREPDGEPGQPDSEAEIHTDAQKFLENDSQVRDALNLLRGINLANSQRVHTG